MTANNEVIVNIATMFLIIGLTPIIIMYPVYLFKRFLIDK